MLFGGFKALTVMISFIVIPYGINKSMDISYLLVAPIPTGLVFSLLYAFLVKKNQKYKIYALICNICIILGLSLMYFTLNSE
jgi:Na+/melibiose symporter-like transporter